MERLSVDHGKKAKLEFAVYPAPQVPHFYSVPFTLKSRRNRSGDRSFLTCCDVHLREKCCAGNLLKPSADVNARGGVQAN